MTGWNLRDAAGWCSWRVVKECFTADSWANLAYQGWSKFSNWIEIFTAPVFPLLRIQMKLLFVVMMLALSLGARAEDKEEVTKGKRLRCPLKTVHFLMESCRRNN